MSWWKNVSIVIILLIVGFVTADIAEDSVKAEKEKMIQEWKQNCQKMRAELEELKRYEEIAKKNCKIVRQKYKQCLETYENEQKLLEKYNLSELIEINPLEKCAVYDPDRLCRWYMHTRLLGEGLRDLVSEAYEWTIMRSQGVTSCCAAVVIAQGIKYLNGTIAKECSKPPEISTMDAIEHLLNSYI